MGVDLGGLGAGMAQQLLDVPQVHALFQQVRRKGVPQGVAGRQRVDARPQLRVLKDMLHAPVRVLAAHRPLEQPVYQLVLADVCPQLLPDLRRQDGAAVLHALRVALMLTGVPLQVRQPEVGDRV